MPKPIRRPARLLAACWVALVTISLSWFSTPARGQLPTSEEQLKILTDPESLKKAAEKDKTRPPVELFRSQVAPFDVLPYVKANHWSTVALELRANYEDYVGSLQTNPVLMAGLPQEIIFRRDARLPKAQRGRLTFQTLLPAVPKELSLELNREDSPRPSDIWPAPLRPLEQDQMLVVVLGKDADAYSHWNRYQLAYPANADRTDALALDKRRYYRFVQPIESDKPPLSPHSLTWTTISHIVWDGLAPDSLNTGQQQAMLDWLHWGGQLTIVGGAGPAFSVLNDSFLAPYLPGESTGDNRLLTEDELKPLSLAYPPPVSTAVRPNDDPLAVDLFQSPTRDRRYLPVAPIVPKPGRPVYLNGLRPRPGSTTIGLGESGDLVLGVERRVGRGRILMLGLALTEPSLVTWPGLDTLVRRVVLRRPEEGQASRPPQGSIRASRPPELAPLAGPDLSWVRLITRDLRAHVPVPVTPAVGARREWTVGTQVPPGRVGADQITYGSEEEPVVQTPEHAVAEWIDAAAFPRLCRGVLEEASGIKIPRASFVLGLIVAYILALVPLNWLLCRYVFRRRELAWALVPVLALGFAIGVERAAAYDLGYNSACDEIDVLESFSDYPRAHLSRFGSLYTTGRTRYTLTYPNEPTALAQPQDNGRSLRGEDVSTSTWQSFPTPTLIGYLVQPRSLAFFRSEAMVTLDGTVTLRSEGGKRVLENAGRIEIRDAVLVEPGVGGAEQKETPLGTIAPGATIELRERAVTSAVDLDASSLQFGRVLRTLRNYTEDRPENAGELRLVGWTPDPYPGQSIEPAVDRRRGFTAVVIHLSHGPAPSPDGSIYDARAGGRPARRSTTLEHGGKGRGPRSSLVSSGREAGQ